MNGSILFLDGEETLFHRTDDDGAIPSLRKGAIGALRIAVGLGCDVVMMIADEERSVWQGDTRRMAWHIVTDVLASEGIGLGEIRADRSNGRYDGIMDAGRSFVLGHGDWTPSFDIAPEVGRLRLVDEWTASTIGAVPGVHDMPSWDEVASFLKRRSRRADIDRTTKETRIDGWVALDGDGSCTISTGIGFFDHMLTQIIVHAGMDAVITTEGDLHIDEHHTIEDTGLALGEALRRALGDKRGIGRYGFVLPMDEARTLVAMDLSDRPFLRWKAALRQERLGTMPTQMVEHFFRSFADGLRCTLHVESDGVNDHHIVESMFKGLGRSLRDAIRDVPSDAIPSSKGRL